MQTLTEAGITSIDVAATNTTETDNAGNRILGTASFTRSDSSTGTVASVDFSVNRRDTVWTGDDTVSTEAQALPDLKGYGTLPSLHISMTLDTNLLDVVETVLPTLDTNNLETLRTDITPILTAWMASVSITAADAGYEAREDVAVLVAANDNTVCPALAA